ncbi:MAG: cyclic nucleotide-binding domain-containing protein [Dissulfuribacterales bacterium]
MILHRRSQKADLLKQVPLFSNLSKRQLNQIAKHADQAEMREGRVFAQQGRTGREFVFIVDGKAHVKKDGKVIRSLSSGDFFGEISLVDGQPRTATVTAETDGTLLVVNGRSFDHLLNTIPGLQKKIMVALCKYIRRAEEIENR